ncbi:hypothetical protein VSR34_09025 [Paraburkholderia sp. JHI2823]|uniref:hypothetical protein n=1 Tax=Paraburkholderia TaxID=1822464 RepID=UPI00041DB997|nr:hypothetical protein [Paraburkholderia mimosarum]
MNGIGWRYLSGKMQLWEMQLCRVAAPATSKRKERPAPAFGPAGAAPASMKLLVDLFGQ